MRTPFLDKFLVVDGGYRGSFCGGKFSDTLAISERN